MKSRKRGKKKRVGNILFSRKKKATNETNKNYNQTETRNKHPTNKKHTKTANTGVSNLDQKKRGGGS